MKSIINEHQLYQAASFPTSNDIIFKTIVNENDVIYDKSFYPYIYREIRCKECDNSSGYMEKYWFGFVSIYDAAKNFKCILCKNKSNTWKKD